MSPVRSGEDAGPEGVARAHAGRIVARDTRVTEDLASGAQVTPPRLLEWLLSQPFTGWELVAHARIGDHHIFKTKLVGPTTVVVQARWAAEPGGRWRIREAEVARVEGGGPVGTPAPASRPAEV